MNDGPVAGVTTPAFVRFQGVSVRYGEGPESVLALQSADLSFAAGDFVCIVGPSGCGKTTMMQTLAGFLTPTSGTVSVDGRAVDGPGPDRGVVFQQPALFPWMTVRANAGFGPRMRGENPRMAAERVERWLRTTGLWDFRDRYPYELSGGMQQRLAIARALCNEPRLLLMDEPFGALDALTRERMQEELHAVWRRTGMTVVFITHSVEEAVYLGTEVVVMSPRPGRIVERIATPFARGAAEENIRTVKSRPDFIALRERVLSLIWGMEDPEA
ncbi:ABC transporter ATP-binding protein [Muricoccus radiodurans]|uniref:ABC transporter ATP-binding protein n=1 Tax=Muricoccus radiodurans TaxID=2231721 RepID=UPI003CF1FAF9